MDKSAVLAQTLLFKNLSATVIQAFAEQAQVHTLHTGRVLFSQGEPLSALYIVATGRLRAYSASEGREKALGEIGMLESIGEISILSDGVHTATVRAVRDSLLLRIERSDLMVLLRLYPEALMQLSQVVVSRLLDRLRKPDPGPPGPRSLALIPAQQNRHHQGLAQGMERFLSRFASTRRINREMVDAALGPGIAGCRFDDPEPNAKLMRWLNELEQTTQYLIYEADGVPGPWARRCMRQADRILVLVDETTGAPEQTPMLRLLAETDVEATATVIMQLHRKPPKNTDPLGWRGLARANSHYFMREDHEGDIARIARQVTETGLGVVLGGGGARGFAHIGLLQAARELNLPIDNIGGTSIGAFIAALYAQGRKVEEILAIARETFVNNNFLNDYTLPRMSLIRGDKFHRRLREIFGDNSIEHLMLPYFCVSSSLTSGAAVVHASGALEQWVGTSMAVPGIVPPVAWRGELLADGAVVNTLPTDVMRALGRGKIIACDVSSAQALNATGVEGPQNAINWDASSPRPSLFDILLRSATVASAMDSKASALSADCYVRMPVQGIGMFDWKSIDQMVERAYEHARVELEKFSKTQPRG